ncbi:3-oxoacyl-[acyl-carrier-protein] synthase III C-terminal domain-containing protein [Amycolatopsis vastitatis]|uniref:3-oxoacyl-ACP synthase n=1 Tax=Amycolatopsis vastitatis TaxID=1905142 RepID=A0A229T1Z0_9PSEU|nr:3-oxoacyl-[acyl-carrier-protein] synthase III C-terminal domain-containing protein [Amycolatopsis vastitatis]OXM65202.1 3-oxoacyl-ACP synthase [Amycolatopsis vastitatis]
MTAIVSVSSHLPETVPLASLRSELRLTDIGLRKLLKFYGLRNVCRSAESEVDSLVAVAGKLAPLSGVEDRVRYVVRAKTMPISHVYPDDSLRQVCDVLGLSHATSFTVTDHACASGLLAVDMCGMLLAADGDPGALALVLLGEKAFTYIARTIADIAVMGEGFAAVLVRAGAEGDGDRLLGYATRTHSDAAGSVAMTPAQAKEFRLTYHETLAEVVHAALGVAGVALTDVDLLLPHNVNTVSWRRTAEAIGLPHERVFLDNVKVSGHCFCADPFLNYRTAIDLGRLGAGDRYVMVSVGLGATFSAMVFQH